MSTRTARGRRIPAAVRWLAVPVALAGLAFLWWTASPLFLSTSVDEAFPTSAPAAVAPAAADAMAPTADAMAQPTGEAMTDTTAPTADAMAQPTGEAMTDTTALTADTMVGGSGATAGSMTDTMAPTADTMAGATADAMAQPTADTMAGAASEPTADAMAGGSAQAAEAAAPTAAPAEPVALSSGSFTFIDNLHWAEGSATIYRLPDGSHVVRLEPFTAQNGPDLYVGISGHPMPRSSAEAYDAGYVELAKLKANQGNQNYVIPADLDLSAFKSVVIYCKAFSVVFSTAELTAQR